MKILAFTYLFSGTRRGLPYIELYKRLMKRNNEVYIVSIQHGSENPAGTIENLKVHEICHPLFHISKIDYPACFPFINLYRILRRYKIDVIHTVTSIFPMSLAAALVAKITNKPMILTIQGAEKTSGVSFVDAIKRMYDLTLARIIAHSSTKVIVLSKYLIGRATEIGVDPKNIVVIPNGVDLSLFNPCAYKGCEVKQEIGLKNRFVVGFIGRLVPLKGIRHLVAALENLEKQHSNLGLLIIGDGPQREIVEKIAKSSHLKVIITGWISKERIPFYLSAIDVLVLPSLSEGIPNSALEAMAMKKPVIATRVGGIPDVVQHRYNGLLIPPREITRLEKYIELLISDEKLREEMGEKGREIVQNRFSWDRIVPRIEDVFNDSLEYGKQNGK